MSQLWHHKRYNRDTTFIRNVMSLVESNVISVLSRLRSLVISLWYHGAITYDTTRDVTDISLWIDIGCNCYTKKVSLVNSHVISQWYHVYEENTFTCEWSSYVTVISRLTHCCMVLWKQNGITFENTNDITMISLVCVGQRCPLWNHKWYNGGITLNVMWMLCEITRDITLNLCWRHLLEKNCLNSDTTCDITNGLTCGLTIGITMLSLMCVGAWCPLWNHKWFHCDITLNLVWLHLIEKAVLNCDITNDITMDLQGYYCS